MAEKLDLDALARLASGCVATGMDAIDPKDVLRLIARIRALESASQPGGGWQPIETAPKTGRTLLLGYLNRAGNWRTVRGQWMSSEYIDQHWEDPDDPGDLEGWYETSVEADDTPNCWHIKPTHWMPLPAAPSAGDGRDSTEVGK